MATISTEEMYIAAS